MPSFITFDSANAGTSTSKTSNLNQLIDVIQEDISGSSSRKKYQVFITGGIGPGVTSSLFQTVFDQDHTLQTANPVLDMTMGLFYNADITDNTVAKAPGFNNQGGAGTAKLLFASQSMMMREKVDIYRQYANFLLGDPDAYFWTGTNFPQNGGVAASSAAYHGGRIDEALFINVRRLFARDRIRKETFAMRLFQSASVSGRDDDTTQTNGTPAIESGAKSATDFGVFHTVIPQNRTGSNLGLNGLSIPNHTGHTVSDPGGVSIVADIGSNSSYKVASSGDVGLIKRSANTNINVGLLFYDAGIAVLDMKQAFWGNQHVHGLIDAMNANAPVSGSFTGATGTTFIGTLNAGTSGHSGNPNAKFIPDFMVSGSIDNIVDHISMTRFSSGSFTAVAFQNQTKINSKIYFCKAPYNNFNISSNPTYTDSEGTFNVFEDVNDPDERPFSFITTVVLTDSTNTPVAVAKLNRPVEKNDETELTFRVRLDF